MHVRGACSCFLASILALCLATSCRSEEAPRDVSAVSGALGLRCDLGEIKVKDINYVITRGGSLYRSGNLVVDVDKAKFSAVIGPLATGDNYAITLSAQALRTASGQSTDCSGTGAFSVASRQTTVVDVPLNCGGLRGRGPNDNKCPSIDSVRAVPRDPRVGQSVNLRADAHDPDRKAGRLKFDWSADGGQLTGMDSGRADFVCTQEGRVAITLKVSDGDETCPEESVTIYVNCRKPLDGVAGARGVAGN